MEYTQGNAFLKRRQTGMVSDSEKRMIRAKSNDSTHATDSKPARSAQITLSVRFNKRRRKRHGPKLFPRDSQRFGPRPEFPARWNDEAFFGIDNDPIPQLRTRGDLLNPQALPLPFPAQEPEHLAQVMQVRESLELL
ncbi:hypothetical protein JIN84_01495 [Luteolibacter yonseiensis]|uniref:Uncharacterized protein n=1 Tax=Luteolibacter yonseiensis TaxID=1144680 RepID=A0A934V5T2_9BACT|nr:hypothetical protein [Luteolibacter yonseiensis]